MLKFLRPIALVLLSAASTAAQTLPPELDALGRAFVNELAARQFDKAVARFDDNMKNAMPAEKLEQAWATLQQQAGAFKSITGTRLASRSGYRIVVVTAAFERADLDVQIVLAADNRVGGLFFSPSQPAAEWKPPAYANPDSFREERVQVGAEPWLLDGTLTLPRAEGRFPAVVLVHGSGPHDEDETIGPNRPFKDLAWGLASRGIAVLRYVKRTRAHGPRLAQVMNNFTMNEETVDDARAAVRLLASRSEIDPRRIYVLGHSQGAYMGPRIAADASVPIAGLILLAGNTRPLEELIVEQVRHIAELDGNITPQEQQQIDNAEKTFQAVRDPDLKPGATINMLGATVPASYFLDLRDYRPAEVASKLKVPMLILQGERDYQVRMADFEGWRRALGGRSDVKLKSYATLNHLFIAGTGPLQPSEYSAAGHVDDEVVRDIAEWILAQRR